MSSRRKAAAPPAMIHGIHPQLVALAVPIDSLTPDPRNARSHDDTSYAEILASYAEHGQRKPIVVQASTRIVRAGNGQIEAAKRLGWTHIAAVVVDEPDAAAVRYALRDNRSAELSDWDVQALCEQLQELQGAGIDVSDLGWNPDELGPLLEAAWEPAPVDPDYQAPQVGEDGASGDGGPGGRRSVTFSADEWSAISPLVAAARARCGRECTDAEAIVLALVPA